MSSGPGNILIRIGARDTGAASALDKNAAALERVQSRGEKMGAGLRRAALPAAAALGLLAVAGKGAADAAAEDEAGQARLAGTLDRVAGATKAQVAASERYISTLSRQTGVADDELRPALGRLASATGDVQGAQDALRLALDISAQSGKSVETVSAALAKAYDGKTVALSRLVPGLDAAMLKEGDMTRITAALADKVGGAAAQAADTAAGRYKIFQVQMKELQEGIGSALIPVMSALTGVMLKATDFASRHTTVVKVLVGVVALLAGGILAANAVIKVYAATQTAVRVATALWSAAQWILNAALSANPIGLVVIGAAALVAVIVLAYKHSETFRGIVGALWSALKANPLVTVISHFDVLVDAVKRAIDWLAKLKFPEPPKWLRSIGGAVGGLFGAPRPAGVAGVARAGRASERGGLRPLSVSSPLTINVHGALDPEGVARQIERVLQGHRRRMGFAT